MSWIWNACGCIWTYSGGAFLMAQICLYATWSIQARRPLGYREFSRRFDNALCEPTLRLASRLGLRKDE